MSHTSGKIYVVATPIGNLEDLTLRAKHVLREVDLVIAEDTRITRKLLAHLMLRKPTVRYDDNITEERIHKIIHPVVMGKEAALVTDAGTPNISDPGWRLIRAALAESAGAVQIIPIPGPSALTTLISIAHFPVNSLLFLAFPPTKGRKNYFLRIADEERPVILYESPHRIVSTLSEIAHVQPQREAIVAKELTKLYERIWRGSIQSISDEFEKLPGDELRGEYVIALAEKKYGER